LKQVWFALVYKELFQFFSIFVGMKRKIYTFLHQTKNDNFAFSGSAGFFMAGLETILDDQ
jgi:hypothetical protein